MGAEECATGVSGDASTNAVRFYIRGTEVPSNREEISGVRRGDAHPIEATQAGLLKEESASPPFVTTIGLVGTRLAIRKAVTQARLRSWVPGCSSKLLF